MTLLPDPIADPITPFGETHRSNWVRLRTLIILRWIAIGGQLGAITIARQLFDLKIETGLCILVIGILTVTNLVAMFVFPENRRLSEAEMVAFQLFDILQLAALLALTGGLNNPFALLILAPVTISATALQTRSTFLVGAGAVALISAVSLVNIPLRTIDGQTIEMPPIFVAGQFVAIVIGIVFIASYARQVTREINAMTDALTATQMALAREQKLTDLGGVVAAAAHELGTPLATITLVSSELADELEHDELKEDARLIRQQADRCRDILRSMGQAGKDDRLMRFALLSAVMEEAAGPHSDRGKALVYDVRPVPGTPAEEPTLIRRPEIVHGVRNFIQNAVDFARTTVWVDARWTDQTLMVRISDDGPGYPLGVLPRLGDPFIRFRREAPKRPARPGYEGMGLGLFIAKTLLERTGAEITFANGADRTAIAESGSSVAAAVTEGRSGAVVEILWPLRLVAAPRDVARGALGENEPITD